MYVVYSLCGADDRLWYVGCCLKRRLGERIRLHFRSKEYIPEVVTHIKVAYYPDQKSALKAELALIHAHIPPYNVWRGRRKLLGVMKY